MSDTIVAREASGGAANAHTGVRGKPWWTLLATALGVIMVALDGTVVAIANPYIASDLHASLSDLQWVTNGYLLALAVLLIPAGKLGDRYGRRGAFLVGVTGFALASLAVGLSGSISVVIFFRVLQGVFGALIMPNTLALLRSAFPADKLNSAVGIWGAATAASTAGGPILAGVLVEHISWQSVFYINIPVGAIALLVGLIVLRESKSSARSRLDLPGLALLGAGLFLLIFGVIKAQTWGWGETKTLGFIAGGLIVLAVFIFVESRVSAPLLPLAMFRDRSVSIGAVTVLLNFFALFGVLFFISLYLQNVHGYSAVGAGIRTLPLTVLFVLSSPLSGWLTGRFGPRVPITLGLLVVSASMIGLMALDTNSAYTILWPPMVGLGLGIGLVVVASTEAIVGNTPVELAGVAGGVQSTFMQLGGVLGSAVLGSVLASRVGSVLVDHLTAAGVPSKAANQMLQAKEFVSQGVAPVPKGTPAAAAQAITSGSHAAFMSGLHVALLVAVIISLAGAFLAPFIRRGNAAAAEAEAEPIVEATPTEILPTTEQRPARHSAEPPTSGHVVRGRVRQPGGQPVARAAITLIDPNGRQAARQLTGGDGSYELSTSDTGSYVLIVRAAAHQPHAIGVELNGAPVELEVTLAGSGGLSGTVRTTTGEPLGGATVTVTDSRGEVVVSGTTDTTGGYAVDDLVAGDYTLVVSAGPFRPVAIPVAVPVSGLVEQDVELAGGASLRGVTRAGGDGRPLADARVSLVDSEGNVVATTFSDEAGRYLFENVSSDSYTVIASSYPPVSAEVRIGSDDRQQHDIELGYPIDREQTSVGV
jgi:EmrB/QacA subfamily drug resistance transporter